MKRRRCGEIKAISVNSTIRASATTNATPRKRHGVSDPRGALKSEQLRPADDEQKGGEGERDRGGEDPAEHGGLSITRPGRVSGRRPTMRGCPVRSICTRTAASRTARSRPAELVASAVAAGIGVLGLTDHDSTAGWDSAFVAAEGTGLTVVPGLELSTQLDYASVHLLGYLVDPKDPGLVEATTRIRQERIHRAESMVGRIAADYDLEWDDVLAQTTPGATVGRPHIADALVARGHVPDRTAAFQTILHWRGGYYRPHEAPPPIEGVQAHRRRGRSADHRASGRARTRAGDQRAADGGAGQRGPVRPRARSP